MLLLLGIASLPVFAQSPIQASGPLIITESNRMVSMRDGLEIALDIYRPAQNGLYPTLYASAPYPHAEDNTPPRNGMTGPVAWFVSQGFNYVIASSRGTGSSQGNYEFLSREEQQDHYEIIEWIAGQSWSDGRVLGVGAEYYATAQWQMAIQNPPSLQCIAPVNGMVRPYHDWAFQGGLSNQDFLQNWYEGTVRRQNAFPAAGMARLVEYDMRLQMLAHPDYDQYWRVRSSLPFAEAITIPSLISDSWQRQQGLAGNLEMLELLNNTHKMAIYSGDGPLLLNQAFLEQDLMPYYRWCLQEEDALDFFENTAQLRYQILGQNLWQVDDWPPQNITQSAMFLNRQSLELNAPANLDSEIQVNSLALSRYSAELNSLTFISAPLVNDLELTGPVMLELYTASSESDTAFEVSVQEQVNLNRLRSSFDLPEFLQDAITAATSDNAESSIINVTSGTLKASMRAAETASINNFDPEYLFSEASPLNPSEVTRLNIALNPVAYTFRAGSRIVLNITQAEDDSLSFMEREDSLYHSQRYPSRLWLPVRAGSLETSMPDDEGNLQDIQIDLQSEEISNPFNINFDTGFSTQLNNQALSDDSLDPVESPIIFIRPDATVPGLPAGQ